MRRGLLMLLVACGGQLATSGDQGAVTGDAADPGRTSASPADTERGDASIPTRDAGSSWDAPETVHVPAAPEFTCLYQGSANDLAVNTYRETYVTGSTSATAGVSAPFLTKIDAAGRLAWTREFSGAGIGAGFRILVDADDVVTLVGAARGPIDLGGGPLQPSSETATSAGDAFIAQFDSRGRHIRSKRLAGSSVRSIVPTDAGFVVGGFGLRGVGGPADPYAMFIADLAPDFSPLSFDRLARRWSIWDSAASGFGSSFVGSYDGDLTVAGQRIASSPNVSHFVSRFGPSREHLWTRNLGTPWANAVAESSAGLLFVGGQCDGNEPCPIPGAHAADGYILALAADGSTRWSHPIQRAGSGRSMFVNAVAVDVGGNVLATGAFNGDPDFGSGARQSVGEADVFVIKLDSQGGFTWATTFGGAGMDSGSRVKVDPSGAVYVVGWVTGEVDLGAGPQGYAGDSWFLRKLPP